MHGHAAGHRGCKHTSASPVPPSPPWGQPQGLPWNFPGKESLFLPFLPLFAFSDLSCWQAGARCWPRIPRSAGWQQHRGRAPTHIWHLHGNIRPQPSASAPEGTARCTECPMKWGLAIRSYGFTVQQDESSAVERHKSLKASF